MNYYLRFFIYQFILFCTLFVINIVFDSYIGKPFTRVDLIAICIFIPVGIIIFSVIDKLYKQFKAIRLRNKILISIPTFILSILFIGLLEQLFF